MKSWYVLVLLATLVAYALINAVILGWTTGPTFILIIFVVILLGFVLLSRASRIIARGKSYRGFLNKNFSTASFYIVMDPERRNQAKEKDEEELPPFQV